MRRVFSPPALIFKGPGFHVTDYRKKTASSDGDGKAPGADKGTADKDAPGKGKAEAKTESKNTANTSGSSAAGHVAPNAGDGKKA